MTISDEVAHAQPGVIGPWRDDQWYIGPVVAEALGITWARFLNKRAHGDDMPPATRIGRRLFFAGSDLNEWMRSRREPVDRLDRSA